VGAEDTGAVNEAVYGDCFLREGHADEAGEAGEGAEEVGSEREDSGG
jgi:hypothetical protein